jgi:hypothetical protein
VHHLPETVINLTGRQRSQVVSILPLSLVAFEQLDFIFVAALPTRQQATESYIADPARLS